MRELDQRLLRRAHTAIRKGTPSCDWTAFADLIVADRALRERHLNKPAPLVNHQLAGYLPKLQTDAFALFPLKLEAFKVEDVRQYLQGLPVYAGFHVFSSDKSQRSLEDVKRESSMAGYTADQILRAPHLLEFFNSPAIVDFVQSALGCVPTLYSVNAWWSFPAYSPKHLNNQYFHRDTDDWRFFTLFVYLTDVDNDSGPHQLIAGTHTLDGTRDLIAQAKNVDGEVPIDAVDTFTNYFGAEFSDNCEKHFSDSIVDIVGPAGTTFIANTVAMHRGLLPKKTPRLVAWARYGLGPNTNSMDLEQGPLSHHLVSARLDDTPRNRYINRLLLEFDRAADPVLDFPGQDLRPAVEISNAVPDRPFLARLLGGAGGLFRRGS